MADLLDIRSTQQWYTWPNTVTWPTVTYPQTRCVWCQGLHTDKCPDLKSVTYRPNGTVERIEFYKCQG